MKYIQAAYVAWNACFKSKMRSHYDTWLSQPDMWKKHESTFKVSALRIGEVKLGRRATLTRWTDCAEG